MKFPHAFNNTGLIKPQSYIKLLTYYNTSIEKSNAVLEKGNFLLRRVLQKTIFTWSLCIPKVTLQTILIYSSTMKPAYEELSIKDHMKTENEAMMEV